MKATLTKPEGKGPFPAVVMFPTGGGWQDTPRHWRKRLNTWGYVTLEVGDENEVPSTFEPLNKVLDAIGALKYLQEVPYVDSDSILLHGECVGYVTSGGTGFRIGQCLTLGYVKNTVDDNATDFEIEILGEACPARREQQAFYDPDNQRLKS